MRPSLQESVGTAARAQESEPEAQALPGELGPASGFWQQYLAQFGRVQSSLIRVREGRGMMVLKWVGEGSLEGLPYRGISVLEIENNEVICCRTYYQAALLTQETPSLCPTVLTAG